MKTTIVILVVSILAAGCSQTNGISGNSLTAQVTQVNGVNSAQISVGSAAAAAASQALPANFSSNGSAIPTIYPYANAVWSTNLPVAAPPAISSSAVVSSNVPGFSPPATIVPITSANASVVVIPGNGQVSAQTNGTGPTITIGPNGTIITNTPPSVTLTPNGATVNPATGN